MIVAQRPSSCALPDAQFPDAPIRSQKVTVNGMKVVIIVMVIRGSCFYSTEVAALLFGK